MPFALSKSAFQDFDLGALHFGYVFSDTSNRVGRLYHLLEDIAHNTSGRQLSDKQTADLSLLIKGASKVFEELGVILQMYDSLGKDSPTIGSKAEKAWKKLRWDQGTIKDFRSRIVSNTTVLCPFNSSLASKTTHRMADNIATMGERVREFQLNEDQRGNLALLKWISPLNFPAQQSAIFSRRQEGTGQWLFESRDFKTWMSRVG